MQKNIRNEKFNATRLVKRCQKQKRNVKEEREEKSPAQKTARISNFLKDRSQDKRKSKL